MTTTPDPAETVAAAERRAAQAKERVSDDLHALQAKLNPKTLALEAAHKAADRGRTAARSAAEAGQTAAYQGLDFARENPAPVAGAVAVTGLFLLRHRIARLFRKKPAVKARSKAKPAHLTHSDQGDHA